MKNLSLLLNFVLLAAVGHLYYLNFSKKAANPAEAIIAPPTTDAEKPVKVAYVNIDTLYSKYEWFNNEKTKLENQIKVAQKNLEAREMAFMKKVQAFQIKAQEGNTPPVELEKEQTALAQEEQAITKESARLAQNLEKQTADANDQLQLSLENKLKELRNQIGYDYVMGYQKGLPTVLLANENLDITKQVLELLNAKTEATPKK